MRILLNQVVEAAEAQNIRRREETAATRSLLNTAKLMESNPVLLRLKELEAVERISEKVDKITGYDGLKGVIDGLLVYPYKEQFRGLKRLSYLNLLRI
jgi:hypothetical protein